MAFARTKICNAMQGSATQCTLRNRAVKNQVWKLTSLKLVPCGQVNSAAWYNCLHAPGNGRLGIQTLHIDTDLRQASE